MLFHVVSLQNEHNFPNTDAFPVTDKFSVHKFPMYAVKPTHLQKHSYVAYNQNKCLYLTETFRKKYLNRRLKVASLWAEEYLLPAVKQLK